MRGLTPFNGDFGKAALQGSDHTRRLMVRGDMKGINPGNLLVKGEWDEAESWLSEHIDN